MCGGLLLLLLLLGEVLAELPACCLLAKMFWVMRQLAAEVSAPEALLQATKLAPQAAGIWSIGSSAALIAAC
jgi:hypothetical protein